jgi:hypothetical protein
MLAKIISALALTFLLTGGALAFIPQPEQGLQTIASDPAQPEQGLQTVASEPAQPEQGLQTVASEPAQPEQGLQTELFASEPHNIYAGHSNSVQPQESLETQQFAADTMLSEPRQFD